MSANDYRGVGPFTITDKERPFWESVFRLSYAKQATAAIEDGKRGVQHEGPAVLMCDAAALEADGAVIRLRQRLGIK